MSSNCSKEVSLIGISFNESERLMRVSPPAVHVSIEGILGSISIQLPLTRMREFWLNDADINGRGRLLMYAYIYIYIYIYMRACVSMVLSFGSLIVFVYLRTCVPPSWSFFSRKFCQATVSLPHHLFLCLRRYECCIESVRNR